MGVDQRMYIAGNFGLRQCLDDKISLPDAVAFGLPMLDCTSAANSKMLADRRHTLLACALHLQQAPAVGMMTRSGCDLDGLAAKRVWHINRLATCEGHAVTEVADVIDDETLNHGAPR
jgi:hypothetical protein